MLPSKVKGEFKAAQSIIRSVNIFINAQISTQLANEMYGDINV